jgi:hypothetical protein
MPNLVYPATYRHPLNHFRDEALNLPFGQIKQAVGVVDITTTPQNAWDVKFRSGQVGSADLVGLVIPAGAVILALGFRILAPSENDVYSGQTFTGVANQNFKLATAATATGTQEFNASASTAYVEGVSFGGSGITLTSASYVFAVPPNGVSEPLDANKTFRLFTTTAADAAGGNASVNKGSLPIVVMASWWLPPAVPRVSDIAGRLIPA